MANSYKMRAVAESSEAPHIYEEVQVVKENEVSLKPVEEECNEAADLQVKNGKKKCSWKCFFAVFVMALLLGTVGTCVFLVYKVIQLQSEIMITQDSMRSDNVQQQSNASLSAVYQQLTENAASLERQIQSYELLAQNDSALYNETQQLTENVASLERQVQLLAQNNSVLHNSIQEFNESFLMQLRLTLDEQLNVYNSLHHTQLNQTLNERLNLLFPSSCAALPPSFPSGYYSIRNSRGYAVSVYCDMTRSCGNVTGGWMRVAELDMRDSNQQCPSGFLQNPSSNSSLRTCVRTPNTSSGCGSLLYNLTENYGFQYSQVCGKVIGYQYGTPEAFNSGIIDGQYVDGVSLTYGDPRQHIWTFAVSRDEVQTIDNRICQCTNSRVTGSFQTPVFVGNDYFCDTGSEQISVETFYPDDPLWDGAGCGPYSTCCSFNTPPWFYKQLPQPTTEEIELRVCSNGISGGREYVAVEQIQIFVQ